MRVASARGRRRTLSPVLYPGSRLARSPPRFTPLRLPSIPHLALPLDSRPPITRPRTAPAFSALSIGTLGAGVRCSRARSRPAVGPIACLAVRSRAAWVTSGVV